MHSRYFLSVLDDLMRNVCLDCIKTVCWLFPSFSFSSYIKWIELSSNTRWLISARVPRMEIKKPWVKDIFCEQIIDTISSALRPHSHISTHGRTFHPSNHIPATCDFLWFSPRFMRRWKQFNLQCHRKKLMPMSLSRAPKIISFQFTDSNYFQFPFRYRKNFTFIVDNFASFSHSRCKLSFIIFNDHAPGERNSRERIWIEILVFGVHYKERN